MLFTKLSMKIYGNSVHQSVNTRILWRAGFLDFLEGMTRRNKKSLQTKELNAQLAGRDAVYD